MKMMFKVIFTVAALLGGGGVLPAGGRTAAAEESLTQDQVLAAFFPDASSIEKTAVPLTPPFLDRFRAQLGYVPQSPDRSGSFPVWVGRRGTEVLGYAVIDDEKGMHEPITFAVLIGPDGAVQRQEVLVYRESEGGGVRRKAFRRQFVGKTVKSPLRAGVDVTIVSGATISSSSMAVGVKRALVIVTLGIIEAPRSPAGRLPGSGS